MTDEVLEPACWSWAIPPLRTVAGLVAEIEAANALLPPDERRDPRAACYLLSGDGRRQRFDAFHAGRCAVCSATGERLVDDHSHATGLVRGRLCHSCNLREGHGWDGVFDLYRERPPAAILGFQEYYVGFGWLRGWWREPAVAQRLTGNRDWKPIVA